MTKYCQVCKCEVTDPEQILSTCEDWGMVLCVDCEKKADENERNLMELERNKIVASEKMPELDMETIKKYICPSATDKEAMAFLMLCKCRKLNPFLNEAYLIKYGNADATIVVGKDAFMRRAEEHPQFDGFEAGIIVDGAGMIEGGFKEDNEILLGGWARVYRKDRSRPVTASVSLKEYIGTKKDGTVSKMWREKPATMIRKVAIVQALREAFPTDLGGMYDSSEMGV